MEQALIKHHQATSTIKNQAPSRMKHIINPSGQELWDDQHVRVTLARVVFIE